MVKKGGERRGPVTAPNRATHGRATPVGRRPQTYPARPADIPGFASPAAQKKRAANPEDRDPVPAMKADQKAAVIDATTPALPMLRLLDTKVLSVST